MGTWPSPLKLTSLSMWMMSMTTSHSLRNRPTTKHWIIQLQQVLGIVQVHIVYIAHKLNSTTYMFLFPGILNMHNQNIVQTLDQFFPSTHSPPLSFVCLLVLSLQWREMVLDKNWSMVNNVETCIGIKNPEILRVLASFGALISEF